MDSKIKYAIQTAAVAVSELKRQYGTHRYHRSIAHLTLNWKNLAVAMLLAGFFTAVIYYGQAYIMLLWRFFILFWLLRFDIKLNSILPLTENNELNFHNFLREGYAPLPEGMHILLASVATLAVFFWTFFIKDHQLPFKVLARLLCAIQAVALISFIATPQFFPYDAEDQFRANLNSGYGLIITVPLLLAVGYYIFTELFMKKILYSALILGYFIILIPHKAVLQFLITYHFSVLYMPILYVCFGPIFDVLLFIALYSWIVSKVPPQPVRF